MKILKPLYVRVIQDKDPKALQLLMDNIDQEVGEEIPKTYLIKKILALRDATLAHQLLVHPLCLTDDDLSYFYTTLLHHYHAFDASPAYKKAIEEKILKQPTLLARFKSNFALRLRDVLSFENRIAINSPECPLEFYLYQLSNLNNLNTPECKSRRDAILSLAARWGRVDVLRHYAATCSLATYLTIAVYYHQTEAVQFILDHIIHENPSCFLGEYLPCILPGESEYDDDSEDVNELGKALPLAIKLQYFDLARRLMAAAPSDIEHDDEYPPLLLSLDSSEALDFLFEIRVGMRSMFVHAVKKSQLSTIEAVVAKLREFQEEGKWEITPEVWRYELSKAVVMSGSRGEINITQYLLSLGGDIYLEDQDVLVTNGVHEAYCANNSILEAYVTSRLNQPNFLTFITEKFIARLQHDPAKLQRELNKALTAAVHIGSFELMSFFHVRGANFPTGNTSNTMAWVKHFINLGNLEAMNYFLDQMLKTPDAPANFSSEEFATFLADVLTEDDLPIFRSLAHRAIMQNLMTLDQLVEVGMSSKSMNPIIFAIDNGYDFHKKNDQGLSLVMRLISSTCPLAPEKASQLKKRLVGTHCQKVLSDFCGETFSVNDAMQFFSSGSGSALWEGNLLDSIITDLFGHDLTPQERQVIKHTTYILRHPNGVYQYPHTRGHATEGLPPTRTKYIAELSFGAFMFLYRYNLIFHRFAVSNGDSTGIWVTPADTFAIEVCPGIQAPADIGNLTHILTRLNNANYQRLPSQHEKQRTLSVALSNANRVTNEQYLMRWQRLMETAQKEIHIIGEVLPTHSKYLQCEYNLSEVIITASLPENSSATIAINLFYFAYLFCLFSKKEQILRPPTFLDKSHPTQREIEDLLNFSFMDKSIQDLWLAIATSYDNVNVFLQEVMTTCHLSLTTPLPFIKSQKIVIPTHLTPLLSQILPTLDQLIDNPPWQDDAPDPMDLDVPSATPADFTTYSVRERFELAIQEEFFIPIRLLHIDPKATNPKLAAALKIMAEGRQFNDTSIRPVTLTRRNLPIALIDETSSGLILCPFSSRQSTFPKKLLVAYAKNAFSNKLQDINKDGKLSPSKMIKALDIHANLTSYFSPIAFSDKLEHAHAKKQKRFPDIALYDFFRTFVEWCDIEGHHEIDEGTLRLYCSHQTILLTRHCLNRFKYLLQEKEVCQIAEFYHQLRATKRHTFEAEQKRVYPNLPIALNHTEALFSGIVPVPYLTEKSQPTSNLSDSLQSECGDVAGILLRPTIIGFHLATMMMYQLRELGRKPENIVFATYTYQNGFEQLDPYFTTLFLEHWGDERNLKIALVYAKEQFATKQLTAPRAGNTQPNPATSKRPLTAVGGTIEAPSAKRQRVETPVLQAKSPIRILAPHYDSVIRDKNPKSLALLLKNKYQFGEDLDLYELIKEVLSLRDPALTQQLAKQKKSTDENLLFFYTVLLDLYYQFDTSPIYKAFLDETIFNTPTIIARFDGKFSNTIRCVFYETQGREPLSARKDDIPLALYLHKLTNLSELDSLKEDDRQAALKLATKWGRMDIITHCNPQNVNDLLMDAIYYYQPAVVAHFTASVDTISNYHLKLAVALQHFDLVRILLTKTADSLETIFSILIAHGTEEATQLAFDIHPTLTNVLSIAVQHSDLSTIQAVVARLDEAKARDEISAKERQYELDRACVFSGKRKEIPITQYLLDQGANISFNIDMSHLAKADDRELPSGSTLDFAIYSQPGQFNAFEFIEFITEKILQKLKHKPKILQSFLNSILSLSLLVNSVPLQVIRILLSKGAHLPSMKDAISTVIKRVPREDSDSVEVLEFLWQEFSSMPQQRDELLALRDGFFVEAYNTFSKPEICRFFLKKGANPNAVSLDLIKEQRLYNKLSVLLEYDYDIGRKDESGNSLFTWLLTNSDPLSLNISTFLMESQYKKILSAWYDEQFTIDDIHRLLNKKPDAHYFLLGKDLDKIITLVFGTNLSEEERQVIKRTKYIIRGPKGVYQDSNKGLKCVAKLNFGALIILMNLNVIFNRNLDSARLGLGTWETPAQFLSVEICPGIDPVSQLGNLERLLSRLEKANYHQAYEIAAPQMLLTALSRESQRLKEKYYLKWRHLVVTTQKEDPHHEGPVNLQSNYLQCTTHEHDGTIIVTPRENTGAFSPSFVLNVFYLAYLFSLFSKKKQFLEIPKIGNEQNVTVEEIRSINEYSFLETDIQERWCHIVLNFGNRIEDFLSLIMLPHANKLTALLPFIQSGQVTIPQRRAQHIAELLPMIDQRLSHLPQPVAEVSDAMDLDLVVSDAQIDLTQRSTRELMQLALQDHHIPVHCLPHIPNPAVSAEFIPIITNEISSLFRQMCDEHKDISVKMTMNGQTNPLKILSSGLIFLPKKIINFIVSNVRLDPYPDSINPATVSSVLSNRCGDIPGILIAPSALGFHQAYLLMQQLKRLDPETIIFAIYNAAAGTYEILESSNTMLMLHAWGESHKKQLTQPSPSPMPVPSQQQVSFAPRILTAPQLAPLSSTAPAPQRMTMPSPQFFPAGLPQQERKRKASVAGMTIQGSEPKKAKSEEAPPPSGQMPPKQ